MAESERQEMTCTQNCNQCRTCDCADLVKRLRILCTKGHPGIIDEAANEIERLRLIEQAARNLMRYNLVGAPDYADWDMYFDELNEVLGK